MDPINYLAGVPQIDFGKRFLSGLQAGAGIGEIQQQADANAQALQQKQVDAQQAAQYQSDVSSALAAPMDQQPQLFAAIALRNPKQYEAINKSFGALSADQQKNELRSTYSVASALKAGRNDLALQQVDDLIDAHKNSGLPTTDLDGLRTRIQDNPGLAYGQVLHLVSGLDGGKDVLANLQSIDKDARDATESDAKVAGEKTDLAIKNAGIVGQTLGSLQGKSAKPAQAYTAIASLQSRGLLSADDAATLKASVPTDGKALDDWFGQQRAAGMKPDEQQKYVSPDANAQLSAKTQVQTTGMNNSTQLAVQDRIDARAKADAESGGDGADFSPAAIDNAAARYNLDGTLPPMGMGKAASAGRTAILNRAAELKAGIDPEQQRRDQLNNKAGIANQNKAIQAFTSGKKGDAVRSFNVLLSHLDTLDSLSDALDNGNVQAINRLGNAYAKATGNAAPTNFEAVKHVVGDEAVKAIVGTSGALGDRKALADAIDGANSTPQLKGVIKHYKELAVGQLGGLEQQYQTSTGLNDFEHLLSPAARLLRAQHGGARPAPTGPAVGTVDGGFRFKGGDPAQKSSWEPVR